MCQVSEINTRFFSQTLSPTNYQAWSGQKLTKIITATPDQATRMTRVARRTLHCMVMVCSYIVLGSGNSVSTGEEIGGVVVGF